jgi:predicted DNA-binding transcriptional regulator AlpA
MTFVATWPKHSKKCVVRNNKMPTADLIRHNDMMRVANVGCTTINRWLKEGTLPKPVRCGRLLAWERSKVLPILERLKRPSVQDRRKAQILALTKQLSERRRREAFLERCGLNREWGKARTRKLEHTLATAHKLSKRWEKKQKADRTRAERRAKRRKAA